MELSAAACDSIRESESARRLFIPSNAYVYCITMKLLLCALCTTIMLGGARVDYDEGDGGIKRRRRTSPRQPALSPAQAPREILKYGSNQAHLNSRHRFFISPLFLSRLIRAHRDFYILCGIHDWNACN
jgi:hypothetical protein